MQPNLIVDVKPIVAGYDYQIVQFHGEFDKAGFSEIKSKIDSLVKDFNAKALVFDFTDLKFINSEGIGYLMEVHTHLVQRDHQFAIIGLNEHVKDIFDAVGITVIVSTYKVLDDFLNEMK